MVNAVISDALCNEVRDGTPDVYCAVDAWLILQSDRSGSIPSTIVSHIIFHQLSTS